MTKSVSIEELEPDIQFQILLQISLRSNATRIMEHYEDKGKFMNYIHEREEKISILIGLKEDFFITRNGDVIYP